MNLLKKGVILLIIPLLSFSAHKYYLSLTEINYVPKEKSLQIIMNVFMDDIELALNEQYNIDLQLTTKKELKNNNEYFKKYLYNHFNIKVNNKKLNYKYIGKEYDGNIVYFYLEVENVTAIKSVTIENKVLIKNFESQQNLIKINIGNSKQSKMLTKEENKNLFKF